MNNINSDNYNMETWNNGICNIGNRNIGNCNVGDNNLGNNNEGDSNSGNRNSGDCNIGDNNTGDCNEGNNNRGNFNDGNENVGDYNTGNRNLGNANTGNSNLGDVNSGNFNRGNGNIGDFNSGGHNYGCFNIKGCGDLNLNPNTRNTPISLFNQPSDWTLSQWKNSAACKVITGLITSPVKWIALEDMSAQEKQAYPESVITQGYLQQLSREEQIEQTIANWKTLSDKQKSVVQSIPNFSRAIFKEITGIDVEND